MQIIELDPGAPMSEIRGLFREYAEAIEVDLCFQGFERELARLPGRYAPPEGRLLLAREGGQPAGCAALRKLSDGICEMKRLYVRPDFRRRGLGRALAGRIVAAAREIGYASMRLDTLASMKEAIQLYESLGFRRIPPYYDNPNGAAIFLELPLAQKISRQAPASG